MKEVLFIFQIMITFFGIMFFLNCAGPNTKRLNSYAAERKDMVKNQIEARGVSDKKVLSAMEKVPRHLFVSEQYRTEAYRDYPLPIGEGQTISQPYIVAIMTELAKLKGDEKVLEIGTGSGYQAAVLSLLCREVYSIEYIESLAKTAGQKLKELGYKNVYVKNGDGFIGWTEAAPFDVIIITCALPYIPDSLVRQLKEQGRIVAPIGEEYETQILTIFEKTDNKLNEKEYEPVRFVPMKGEIKKE